MDQMRSYLFGLFAAVIAGYVLLSQEIGPPWVAVSLAIILGIYMRFKMLSLLRRNATSKQDITLRNQLGLPVFYTFDDVLRPKEDGLAIGELTEQQFYSWEDISRVEMKTIFRKIGKKDVGLAGLALLRMRRLWERYIFLRITHVEGQETLCILGKSSVTRLDKEKKHVRNLLGDHSSLLKDLGETHVKGSLSDHRVQQALRHPFRSA